MRRGFKWLLWMVLGPLTVLLMLGLAWLACNGRWSDAAPQPVPSALQPEAVTLAPQHNAFFDAQGLSAPEGEAVNAWGQRNWRGDSQTEARLLVLPNGDDWHCNPINEDCVLRWQIAAAALTAQMAAAKTFGERCNTLAGMTGFQEPLPVRRRSPAGNQPDTALAFPKFSGLTTCLRWLQIEAVLAPDATRAQLAWTRADALLRLVASGSQTLITQGIAWVWVTRQQQLLVQWAARQPTGDTLPAAWWAPFPSRLLQPATWMASESYFQRETIAMLKENGEQLFGIDPNPLQAWAGRHSIGYLPELTVQTMSAHWLADLHTFGHLQGPALAQRVRSKPAADESGWRYFHWRNTVGHLLVEVARPEFERFALRQADLVLYQAALELSRQLNAVPAADRPAWWQRQQLDAGIRERLTLDGDVLAIRTWRGEVESAYAAPVRFPLRPA